jgi:hypothetical protein
MAGNVITNTFQQFQAIGVREELSDIIYNISPTECPFLQNAGRGKISNTFFEWQTDALATASTTNHQVEGDDLGTTGYDAVTPTVRLGNRAQISRKSVIISDTEEIVDKAGRKSEISYQLAKKGKELKRDMEADLLSNHGSNAGSASTARVTAALLAFLKTNIDKASDGTAPVYTTEPTDVWTDGTARAFTETILKNVVQQCWTNGAEPKTVMVGAAGKQVVSTFSGIVELMSTQEKLAAYTIIGAADAYVSDFGTLAVVPNRFQRTSTAFVLDWDFVSVDYLRPFKQEPMAKTGDAEKRMLIVEYGLRVKNEKALGVAVDLTP